MDINILPDILPLEIKNKIFYYLCHPISDLFGNKAVFLEKTNGCYMCYNFTNDLEKGIVKKQGNKSVFEILSDADIFYRIIKNNKSN